MGILRRGSKLNSTLGVSGSDFVERAVNAILRLLPHVEMSPWEEQDWMPASSSWIEGHRAVRVTVAIGERKGSGSGAISATVRRRRVESRASIASAIIDSREHDICGLVATRVSKILLEAKDVLSDVEFRKALLSRFDEMVVADHVRKHHGLELSVSGLLEELHKLSEQSYENKSLAFGCVLDPKNRSDASEAMFPGDFFSAKKFKALSDGYRTAYLISTHGRVVDFIDLERSVRHKLTEKHHYPEWAESMAKASHSGRCGILLSRQGDILIFDQGTLRFTYRFGQWQYWNHAHLIKLLRDRAKAKRVQKAVLGRVVGAIYRAALDISFRRSGGLFVILHNQDCFREILRSGDAIGDDRGVAERQFDSVFASRTIQSLPRSIVVELASLDGAVVIKNSGGIAAYGAVLQPQKKGRLSGSEGSRTKAAIGASYSGISIKISSDGEISVYGDGKRFIVV